MRLVVSANAQEREEARFRSGNDGFVDGADVDAAAHLFLRRLPGLILSAGTSMVFLYGGLCG